MAKRESVSDRMRRIAQAGGGGGGIAAAMALGRSQGQALARSPAPAPAPPPPPQGSRTYRANTQERRVTAAEVDEASTQSMSLFARFSVDQDTSAGVALDGFLLLVETAGMTISRNDCVLAFNQAKLAKKHTVNLRCFQDALRRIAVHCELTYMELLREATSCLAALDASTASASASTVGSDGVETDAAATDAAPPTVPIITRQVAKPRATKGRRPAPPVATPPTPQSYGAAERANKSMRAYAKAEADAHAAAATAAAAADAEAAAYAAEEERKLQARLAAEQDIRERAAQKRAEAEQRERRRAEDKLRRDEEFMAKMEAERREQHRRAESLEGWNAVEQRTRDAKEAAERQRRLAPMRCATLIQRWVRVLLAQRAVEQLRSTEYASFVKILEGEGLGLLYHSKHSGTGPSLEHIALERRKGIKVLAWGGAFPSTQALGGAGGRVGISGRTRQRVTAQRVGGSVLKLSDMVQVRKGASARLRRRLHHEAGSAADALFLSLVTSDSAFDFECRHAGERNQLHRNFSQLLNRFRSRATAKAKERSGTTSSDHGASSARSGGHGGQRKHRKRGVGGERRKKAGMSRGRSKAHGAAAKATTPSEADAASLAAYFAEHSVSRS